MVVLNWQTETIGFCKKRGDMKEAVEWEFELVRNKDMGGC